VTRRSRIIALQAALVGVLLVVVYATILRPNDDSSVSGVSAPGPPPGQVATGPGHDRHHQTKPRPPRHPGTLRQAGQQPRGLARGGGVAGAGAAGGAPAGLAPAAGGTPVSGPTGGSPGGSPPDGGGAGDESPTDDQYNDTLARLNAALH
jgi:hypothetical protein